MIEKTGANISCLLNPESLVQRRQAGITTLSGATGQITGSGLSDDPIVATGGGVVLRPQNRGALAGRGYVIYLYATVDEQVRRTRRDRKRPLLQKGDPEQVLRALMAERDPLYREIADYIIETDTCSPRTVAQRLVKQLTAD